MAEVASSLITMIPIIVQNRNVINDRIKERLFKIDKKSINIHCTLFNRFKQTYQVDYINHIIMKSILKYRYEEKDCTYKIKDTLFTVIPYFAYTQPDFTNFGMEESENTVYPNERETPTFIPGVGGVTIYIFFTQSTNASIINCQILLDHIQTILLKELNVKQQGKFLYIVAENEKNRDIIMKKITKKYDDNNLPSNKSGDNNEIKIRYSDLLFAILSKLLNK